MAAFGINAIHPTLSRAHIFGHAGTPTGRIFEIWKGNSNTANPFWVASNGDVLAAPISSPSIATSATGGYFFMRTCDGTPTGVPANYASGNAALVYDRTNHKLYAYAGAWRGVTVS